MENSMVSSPSLLSCWKLYFTETLTKDSIYYRFVNALMTTGLDFDILTNNNSSNCYLVDYDDIRKNLGGQYKEMKEFIFREPEKFLNCINIIINEILIQRFIISVPVKLSTQIHNLPEYVMFKDLKASAIGRLVQIKATIVKMSMIKPQILHGIFECKRCSNLFSQNMIDGVYSKPSKCMTYECNSKLFSLKRSSKQTKMKLCQQLRVQEIWSGQSDNEYNERSSGNDGGRVPRQLDVDLIDELVDNCFPGDHVVIVGIVKSENDCCENSNPQKGLLLQAISMRILNKELITLSQSTCEKISKIRNTVQVLVNSFSPQIYGHEIVKFGILLALFGGNLQRNVSSSHHNLSFRSDIHILILGDPGLGKSQLLTFASFIAPRSVYVTGTSSSSVGLTATVITDGNGNTCLEAGAMVLADQGICCIDEFDKLNDGGKSLLEVMEQQSVSIAKAGILARLPAKTGVIAAANPIGGHFNHQKTISENIKMNPAILSRFDLVFVLLDKSDIHIDQKLSDHVLKKLDSNNNGPSSSATHSLKRELSQSYHYEPNVNEEILDPMIFKQYIAYARDHCHPIISKEAAEKFKKYYIELRKKHNEIYGSNSSVPITPRHLEALIRLGEARAKMELRSIVLESDADSVISLMKSTVVNLSTQTLADTVITGGSKCMKQPKNTVSKQFMDELIKISVNTLQTEFTEKQLKDLYTILNTGQSKSFLDTISFLNDNGYIIRKPGNNYKLCVT